MKTKSIRGHLNIFKCPECGKSLQSSKNKFTCKFCKANFPIINNIPRLLTDVSKEKMGVKVGFGSQWKFTYNDFKDPRSSHGLEDSFRISKKEFLEDVELPPEWFKNKICLDAGCGMGRRTHPMAELGSKIFSFDLTDEGVEIARQNLKKYDNVTVVQGDILKPPFKEKSFDFIISWGVLHHTPNTRYAFEKLIPLLKEDGIIFIMVYEKHNPFKLINTETLRKIFTIFSDREKYKICGFMSKISGFKPLRFFLNIFITAGTNKQGNFDCYNTPINHHHTEKEVLLWFKENKLKEIKITNKTIYSNPLMKFFRGKHRGTIRVRGRI